MTADDRWTSGMCWRCDEDPVPVLWIGAVQRLGETAPLYVCGPCLGRLAALVDAHASARYSLAHTA